jgi:hypothetical protein
MECNVDEKPGENGNAESRGEDMVSPASYVTAFLSSGCELTLRGIAK